MIKSEKPLKIGEVARILGVSTSMVRVYVKQGRLPCSLTPGGQRVFSSDDVKRFKGESSQDSVVFYVRSSKGDKKAMDSQEVELTRSFGEPVKVYRDSGSGLNENRRNLNRMLDDAAMGKFTKICVTHEDRLSRFGVSFIKRFLSDHNVEVEDLYDDRKADREEVLSDFMAILASFSGRYYRLRSKREQRSLLDTAKDRLDG